MFIFVCGVRKCSNLRLSLFIILPVFNLVVEEAFVKGNISVELFLGQEIISFKQITPFFFSIHVTRKSWAQLGFHRKMGSLFQ